MNQYLAGNRSKKQGNKAFEPVRDFLPFLIVVAYPTHWIMGSFAC
jgi:hypothetical protein